MALGLNDYMSRENSALRLKFFGIFYGWRIVFAFAIIALLMNGSVILAFTAFYEPITMELGWSYTQISVAASFWGVETGLLAPIMGFIVNRWGPPKITILSILVVGLAMVFLSETRSLAMFYIGFGAIAVGLSCNSPVIIITTTANWFRKRMGLATAITGSGFALGGLTIPFVVSLIHHFGWRAAFLVLGISIMIICFPLALIIRFKPEPYGYRPDGEKTDMTDNSQSMEEKEEQEVNIGIKQALLSRSFWHFTIALTISYCAIMSITTHIMPFLESVGVSRTQAGFIASSAPIISIVGRIGSGWLGDKYNLKRVTTSFFLVLILSMICFYYASSEAIWLTIFCIVLYGLSWGSIFTLRAPLVRKYFGRSNYGPIFGLMIGFVTTGGIVGPLFAGWVFDTYASYRFAWATYTILIFIATIIISSAPPAMNNFLNTGHQERINGSTYERSRI